MLTNRSIPSSTVMTVLVNPDVRAAVAWLTEALGFAELVQIGEAGRRPTPSSSGSERTALAS